MAYASYLHLLVKILQAIDLDVLEMVDGLAGREGTGERRVVGDLARTASRRIERDSRIACLPSVVFTIRLISSFLIMSTMCGRPSRTLFARRQAIPAASSGSGRAVRRDDLEAARDQAAAPGRRRRACRGRAR